MARRALQPPAPPALRALGCGGKRAAVRRACSPLGEARSSRVVSAPKKCGRGCSQAGSGRWCWGSGTQSWGSGKNKGWGRRKFFSLVLQLEGPVGKHSALCLFLLCFWFFSHQIMPKQGLKTRVSSSHIPSKDLHTCPSSFPLIIRAQDVQRL